MISARNALACLAASAMLGGCSFFSLPDVEPQLVRVELTGPARFPAGVEAQLAATGTFSDGSVGDLTASMTWTSLDPSVATISAGGVLHSVAPGSTTIVATDPATSVSASAAVVVTEAQLLSIAVTPSTPSVPLGVTAQFTATGTYGDGTTQDLTTTVAWSSSVPSIAAFSGATGARGLASTGGAGETTIAAAHPSSGVSGSTTLTVISAQLESIAVTPPSPTAPVGVRTQLTAVGTYTDGTTQDLTSMVAWSSSSERVASVSSSEGSKGLARGHSAGSTTIEAADPATGISASTALTITPAQLVSIAVTPTAASVPLGLTRQLTATGTYTDGTTQDVTADVTWSSSQTDVASISNAATSKGLASSARTGTTTVRAADAATSVAGSTTLSVTPARLVSIAVAPTAPSVPLGLTKQFTATGTYTDGTAQDLTAVVTWSSSQVDVASISNAATSKGLASSASAGTTTIRAADATTSVAGSTTLSVTPAQLVSIAVTPTTPSMPLGLTKQFTATGTYTDGTAQDVTADVTWSSSQAGVASISNAATSKGLASSASTGTTTIRAADAATSIAGSTTLSVTPAQLVSLSVTPVSAEVPLGGTQQLIATGTYSDGSEQDLTTGVTWTSSELAVAEVSNASGSQGLATSLAAGSTTIQARDAATGLATTSTMTVILP